MDRLDAAFRYLDDDRPECKVVGIMIIISVLGAGGARSEPPAIIRRALELVGVPFILQMIIAKEDSSKKGPSVCLAGLEFALMACSFADVAGIFFNHLTEVLVIVDQLFNRPVMEQYVALIVLIALSSRKRWKAVVDALLEKLATGAANSSTGLLQVFPQVAATRCDGDESQLEILQEKADNLRSVVIRGLHGAAPQAQRDATLIALGNMLSCRVQPHSDLLALSPSWTIVSNCTQDESKVGSGEGLTQEARGAFAQVLCAVVRGELQLLCDEALFLATSTPDAVAERFSLEVPARPHPAAPAAAPSGDCGTATDTAAAAQPDSVPTPTPVPPRTPDPANDVAYFQGRASRTVAMFCTCLRLLEAFLEQLVGSLSGQPSEQGPLQEPAWATLPVEALMQIKRSLYGAIDDLFTFTKDCSEFLTACEPRSEIHFLAAGSLRSLLCCAADSLAVFVVQDAQLAATYIDRLPDLLKSSHLRLKVDGSVELRCGMKEEQLAQSVRALGEGVEDLKARLSEGAGYRPGEATSTTSGEGKQDDMPGEVVLHLVGALLELAGDALQAEGPGGANSTGAEGADGGLSVDSAALERLCDYMPQLLPRLLYLVHVSVVHIQAQGTVTASDAHLLRGTADLCRLFGSLVGVYESRHNGELQILRAQEGDQVVLTALGVDLRRHSDTAMALNALCAQLSIAKESDTQGFHYCLEAFQDFRCVFEHTLPRRPC